MVTIKTWVDQLCASENPTDKKVCVCVGGGGGAHTTLYRQSLERENWAAGEGSRAGTSVARRASDHQGH